MMWWPLLFIPMAFAEDLSVEKFCYSSPPQMQRSLKQLQSIAVPADRIVPEDNCFIVNARPHRRELIQNYLRSVDSSVSIAFSSSESQSEPCRIKVEKEGVISGHNQVINIQSGIGQAQSTTQTGKSTETMEIQTLKSFTLKIDQDAIEGECRYITANKYEITLEVRKDPKPLHPPVSPGTIVVIQNPPPDQKTFKLNTQIQITKGSRIEIGKIIRDLKNQNQHLDISPKASASHINSQVSETVFLSIF